MFLKFLVWFSSLASRVAGEIHYVYRRLTGKTKGAKDFQELVNLTKDMSPSEFNGWLRSSFRYESDGIDFSKHPLVFMYDRAGDCDDFAHLAARLLEANGYSTYIISVFADVQRGHAVCVGKHPVTGAVFGFGNWQLMEFASDDPVVVGRSICKIGYNSKPQFIIKFDNRWRWQKFYDE